jgi:hypothetical protein
MKTARSLIFAILAAAPVFAADPPVFPYGAVYFRKSNPPEQDWARDHQTAARIGMNTFRHWFMWGAIEVAPGKYDWRDYDRMMDLAAQNGIRVVIAELITDAPEWMFRKYPHARFQASDGSVLNSSVGGSATGGFPGLCRTFPGGGYYLRHSPSARAFFAGLLQMAGVEPKLRTDNPAVQARLHSGTGNNYLWVVNPSRAEAKVSVALNAGPAFGKGEYLWGKRDLSVGEHTIAVTVPARDAAVIALR